MTQSTITIDVTLDIDKIPEQISWNATQSSAEEAQKAKAMMLSFWDGQEKAALRIDLWTKEMLVDDMKRFFYENMMTMAETYQRATNDAHMTREIKKFAEQFAKETELFKIS